MIITRILILIFLLFTYSCYNESDLYKKLDNNKSNPLDRINNSQQNTESLFEDLEN
jgi:type III secretory pathway lipoprotein EscJ